MSKNKILLQRLTAKDMVDLEAFFKYCLKDVMEKEGIDDIDRFIKEETDEKMGFAQRDLDSSGKDYFFLVAKSDEKILGTIAYGPAGSLIVELSNGAYDKYGEIGSVLVHPDYHNQGIGTLMLNAMYLVMLGKGITSFCLDSGYTIAKKIWTKKLGTPNIISKDHWGEGFDHYVWFRSFDDIEISLEYKLK